jgi:conjugative transfer signal peptidase TraF
MPCPLRSAKRLVVITGGTLIAAVQLAAFTGLRFNYSPSLPLGVYRTTSDTNAPVEFCPAEPFASFAAQRGYRGEGSCPDGASPMLKPVIAHESDLVRVSPQGIAVNGRLLPNTAALSKDSKGRPLTAWPSGTYRVEAGAVWVTSSYSSKSFDSRYFGPILVSSIRKHVRPLLVWAW